MASRQLSAKKPKDLGHTLRTLLSYLGRHKLLFLAVGCWWPSAPWLTFLAPI